MWRGDCRCEGVPRSPAVHNRLLTSSSARVLPWRVELVRREEEEREREERKGERNKEGGKSREREERRREEEKNG